MGVEPTSSAWKAEVLPLNYTRAFCPAHLELTSLARHRAQVAPDDLLVEGVGFEPTKAEPSDLQSDPFGHSGTPPQRKPHIVRNLETGVKNLAKNRTHCRWALMS